MEEAGGRGNKERGAGGEVERRVPLAVRRTCTRRARHAVHALLPPARPLASCPHPPRRCVAFLSHPAAYAMDTLIYRQYSGESELPHIMALVQHELSEPYVIYTYRYFLQQWCAVSLSPPQSNHS